MPRYYSLGASLPMLKRDESPAIGMDGFLAACSEWLSPERLETLKGLDLVPPKEAAPQDGSMAANDFMAWEKSLRNRLARLRAGKLGLDPETHCLPDESFHPDAERAAQEAGMAPNPLERERLLDAARWYKLEDLELGHFFDFDSLCIYKLKLMIREKWQRHSAEKGAANLDAATGKVRSQRPNPEASPAAKAT